MRGTVLGQQHAGQGGSGPRLPVAPRREARVTCPAAPAAAPHRRARQGLSAGRSVVLPPWPPPGEGGLSVTPSISSAFVLVRIRCCRRSSRASNRNGLISCSTRARVLWPSLRDHPHPDRSRTTKTRQMMSSLEAFSKKLTAERACCTMFSTSLSQ